MYKEDFADLLSKKVMILDGATGTELMKRGMPSGACVPEWILENPDALIEVQKNYIDAGSDIIYAPTFGANRYSLNASPLKDDIKGTNEKLVALSRKAVDGEDVLVAGDISPTGRMLKPLGDLSFDDCVEAFKEQAEGMWDVDLFVIETMLDIAEARAAIIAVREVTDKPIMVSMTFEKNGKTLTGTDPVTALITLQSMGADVVGSNCSQGPEGMVEVLMQMRPHATVPLLAKPNVGLPPTDDADGYDVTAEDFGDYVQSFVNCGVLCLGACCGSDPMYIAQAKKNVWQTYGFLPENEEVNAVTSMRKTVFVTEKVKLSPEFDLSDEDAMYDAQDAVEEFDIIRVKIPKNLENIEDVLGEFCAMVSAPLCFNSEDKDLLERALRIYNGRAMVQLGDDQGEICDAYGVYEI